MDGPTTTFTPTGSTTILKVESSSSMSCEHKLRMYDFARFSPRKSSVVVVGFAFGYSNGYPKIENSSWRDRRR